jgi:putative hydrolase of the HAD superfamily
MPRIASNARTTIVFDFAGVLFHWNPPALLRRELPHRAHDEASAAYWEREIFQGYQGDWGDFDRGRLEPEILAQRIANRTGLESAEARRVIDAVPHELAPIPETVAWLRRLRDAGRTLFFLSNMPVPYAEHLAREHEFVSWFGDGIFSCHVGMNKPEAGIFRLAEQRFGTRPEEVVFMDDTGPNVEMATSLGWRALLFRDVVQAERELCGRGWLAG